MIDSSQWEFENFICDYWTSVCEPKEGVVSEDGLDAHGASVKHRLVGQGGEGLQLNY